MTCIHPYMLRRADCYYFRIKVPTDLRAVVGQREFTRSLKTGDRTRALPLALQLAALAKHLFHALRSSTMNSGDLLPILHAAKAKLKLDDLKDAHAREIDDLHERRIRELREATLQAKVDALQQAIGQFRPAHVLQPAQCLLFELVFGHVGAPPMLSKMLNMLSRKRLI